MKLNILHALSQHPDATGSGIYIRALIKEAIRAGHRNFLLAGASSSPVAEWVNDIAEDSAFVQFNGRDLPYPIPGMSDVMPYPSRRFSEMTSSELIEYEDTFTGKLKQIQKRFTPNIIHSHHLWLMSSVIRRIFTDVPLCISSHGSDIRQFRKCPELRDRVIAGVRDADAVFALTALQKLEIQSLYGIEPGKIHVVGAGYDKARFRNLHLRQRTPIRILYAGKLSRSKGVLQLLQALDLLQSDEWECHIAGGGSGPEQQEILAYANRFGNKVHIHGAVSQKALVQLMHESHLFVLPTFYEGFGLVLLEALACGCRLITTALPSLLEILQDTDPRIVRFVPVPELESVDEPIAGSLPGFVLDLANAIDSFLDISAVETDFSSAQAASALDRFTWESVFQRVSSVYCGVGGYTVS